MTSSRGRGAILWMTILGGAIALGLVAGASSAAAPSGSSLNDDGVGLPATASESVPGQVRDREAAPRRETYLLKLKATPTLRAFRGARDEGLGAARRAERAQRGRIAELQDEVAGELPGRTKVLYETRAVIAGLGVQGVPGQAEQLEDIPGVASVHPIVPKEYENSYAMELQGAAGAWSIPGGDAGEGVKIAVVDSGIDYTHSDFGGPGSPAVFEIAQAGEALPANPLLYPNDKVVGGHDFVGDTYQPDDDEPGYQPNAIPDSNPLDCGGHGSHVAGSAAGYGVNADGSTYTGAYGPSTDFDAFRIGPGMAPKAELLAYKVFGCTGTTSWVTAAIDRAAEDGADVINLSVGSDFGSSEDGDSVAADAAVAAGISVVSSAGNASDRTDISGSPGNASRAITVANSQDAVSRIDGTEVEIEGNAENYGSTRSFAYDWANDPDLAGTVVRPPGGNLTACDPYPAGTFESDEVVLVEWTDDALECGSVQRSGNLDDAGAGGFIFASNKETFSAGITGSEVIPGVLMVASGADALREAVDANQVVEVIGTSANSVTQEFPADDDKVNQGTSRGIHEAGNVKPDVAAVGTSVFSANVGTGDQGVSESGTSMSSPIVAGLAALVEEAHPDWTPLQVKASIMNTATHDVTVNGILGPPSDIFSPVRVGAGRIDADQAVHNEILAYNPERGAVSVSFGPVEVSGPTTLTKQVTVENDGEAAATYDTAYEAITEVPGVTYSVSPGQITVPAGGTRIVQVTLSAAGPDALTKTVDPTVGRDSAIESATPGVPLPRETLAEAAGRIVLEPAVPGVSLRVPVYAAPRPAARMDQADTLEVPTGADPSAPLELTGTGLGQDGANGTANADPDDDIFSIAAGFELAASSGVAPTCGEDVVNVCVAIGDDRGGDVRHVGYTSTVPYADPGAGRAYFAISTRGPNSIPESRVAFQVEIDVDGDRAADLFLLNNRLVQETEQVEDVFVSTLIDPEEGVIDTRGLNGRFGNLDTAAYDSDTLVLPFATEALAAYGIDASNPRINYGVATFSYSSGNVIDLVGFDEDTGDLELSADLFAPGVTVTDEGQGPLVEDVPGSSLTVTRNPSSYAADAGQGLMMVHFHNHNGNKSQVVDLTAPGPNPPGGGGPTPPRITAEISSPKGKTRGWYRTPVKVTFTCVPGEAPLAGACPGPVTLSRDGRGQTVTRGVAATDGRTGSVTVRNINVDRTRPTVRIKGVRKGKRYRKAPRGRCVAKDKTSKVHSCRIKRKRRGKTVTYTAKATDRAGNVRTVRVKARIGR